jgi:purine catabolism regulator
MNDHTISFKELLRLSYSQNYCWISDEPTNDILVQWVATIVGEVQKGDILLIPPADLTPRVVKETQKRGGGAIILAGDAHSGEYKIDPEFPVVALPGEADPRVIHRVLLNILINRRASLMQRGVRVHTQLSKLAAEGEGLAGLTQAMSELSGRGVVVQDKRLGILAEYPSSSLISIWDDVLEQLGGKSYLPDEFADRKKAGMDTIVLRQKIHDELERLVTPITVKGVARGYLSLIDVGKNLDALDHLIAEQGVLVCAMEMARAKAVREAEKRLKGDLLTALLQEDITPRDANLWIQSMGMDLDKNHVAIRFAWDAPSPPSMRRLETLVNGEVTRGGLKVLVEALGSEIVCVCQVDVSSGRPEIALKLSNTVANLAAQEFPHVPMRCGIGLPATDLGFWRDSFRQAGQSLEMARRLDERIPLYFPDLSVYRLLLQLEHHPDLLTFKNEILGSLLVYEGGGDFIKTLEVYFDHNGILSQAAEALFIHRNTLSYRMERIAEITGLDLDNTETRLAVQLALRIHRMVTRD